MTLATGQWWDSGALIGWATFLVGLAAITVSVLLYLRGRRPEPRSELVQYISPVRLLAKNLGDQEAGNLKVMYRDRTLSDPYLVRLSVESVGQKDIASTRFDAGKPLVFDLSVPIVAVLGSPSGSASAEGCLTLGDSGRVDIAPHLIREGRVLNVELLTEGGPLLTIDSPLVEVDIHERGVDDSVTVRRDKMNRYFDRFGELSPAIAALAATLVACLVGFFLVWHR
jgi:hypothetical protein